MYHLRVTVTLKLKFPFLNSYIWSIFLLLFEVGIPNLVCECILQCRIVPLEWQSVIYQFCDLDLISTIIVSGAYLIYNLREESQMCCMDISLDADVSHTIFRSL